MDVTSLLDGIKYVGGVAGAATAVIAFFSLVIKPIRKKFFGAFGSRKAQLAMLRNDITTIYYKHLVTKSLPTYARENLILLYEAYVGLGGNSYVCEVYKDMLTWEVAVT